jgi:hypothetical protein
MCTGGSFPGITQPGREADHSPPSSAEVKNGGAIAPFPHMSSWHSAYLINSDDDDNSIYYKNGVSSSISDTDHYTIVKKLLDSF